MALPNLADLERINRSGGTAVRSASSPTNPNRRLHLRGNDRQVAQQASNRPTVRKAAETNAISKINSGSARNQIRDMQRALNARGANLVVDGIMGPNTRAAQARYASGGGGAGGGGTVGGNTGGGGSVGGGGTGGVGGSGSTTPSTGTDTRLEELRAARLAAALQAIGAQFASQKGGLEGQITSLDDLFNRSLRQNERQGERNLEGVGNAAAERGLLRSGIYAEGVSNELANQAEQDEALRSQISTEEGAEGLQVRELMSAIELLTQQRASAEAGAELESEQGELDIAQLIALMNAGLTGG